MAVAPLSLRTEDPGLSGVLGMAKVAASGTHLAEARSQSAQGFRVFSFSVRIPIFSFLSFTFWSAFLFHWISLWMNCIPCQVYSACLVSWTSFLSGGNSSWFARILVQRWFLSMGFILISRKCLRGMISNEEMHPDLIKISGRDDFQRGNAS